MTPTPDNSPVELGDFRHVHRVWKVVSGLSIAVGLGLVSVGVAWDQLTVTLWVVVGLCGLFAAAVWSLTRLMQRSLRIDSHGLISASAMRESALPWSEIARARVGKTEIEYFPKLIIDGPDGNLLSAYGKNLIIMPLDEAAALINERLDRDVDSQGGGPQPDGG